ncbi:hypothetical protein V6615_08365 [Oscillospiraceae bacterium PP1C4]
MENDKKQALLEMESEIKLHINNQLFEKGLITAEMFDKAKIYILRQKTTYHN